MQDRDILRRKIRALKKQMSEEDRLRKSLSVWEQVEAAEQFGKADTVLMYWSLPDEVHTHDFILRWHGAKKIILPAINGDTLVLREFTGTENLLRHPLLHIGEPKGPDLEQYEKIELAVIPGIAFGRDNARLGRGKAYYDRLLPFIHAYKIGVCFDFQLLDTVPTDKHDIPVDRVITDC